MAKLAVFNGVAMMADGTLAASATVEVRNEHDNVLSDIFSDEDGANPITNPSAFGGADGAIKFYASGLKRGYKVTVTKDAQSFTLRNVALGTAGQVDAEDFGELLAGAETREDAAGALAGEVDDRSSDTILTQANILDVIRVTGTYTQTLDPAADLGDGWSVEFRVESGATLTIDPDSAETVNGAATLVVVGPSSFKLHSNGAALYTTARAGEPATQAQTEAAASVDQPVTPGRQHFHPSAAKAWVSFVASTGVINSDYNVLSVDDDGTGNFGVNWDTDFADANYAVVGTAMLAAANSRIVTFDVIAAGNADLIVESDASSAADADSVFVVAFGDH